MYVYTKVLRYPDRVAVASTRVYVCVFFIKKYLLGPHKHTHTLCSLFMAVFSFSSRMDGKFYVTWHLIANPPRRHHHRTQKNHWSVATSCFLFYKYLIIYVYSIYICIVYKVVVTLATTTRCLISAAKATAETWTYLWILRIFTQIHIRSDMNYLFLHVTLMQIALLDCCVGF